ncbi:conserved hypothetical protein [Azospirillaceae bacterium]
MSTARAFAIEVQGRSAGIVVAERNGFLFFAADSAFRGLECRMYRSPSQAERAAQALAANDTGTRGR